MVRYITSFIVICSLLLLGSTASAQQTGSNSGAGGGAGTGGNFSLPTLDLQGNFGAADQVFQDTRRDPAQSGGGNRAGEDQAGGAAGGRGGFGAGGGGFGQIFGQIFGGGGLNAPSSARRTLRAPLRADIDVVRPAPTQTASVLSNRLANIRPLKTEGVLIQVEMVERTAVLRGSVATQAQKDLAERMTRLEPGVSEIVNELIVSPR